MNAALNCYLDYYNNDRLHRSLNIRTPNQRTESACGPRPGPIALPLNIRMPNQQTESLDVAA